MTRSLTQFVAEHEKSMTAEVCERFYASMDDQLVHILKMIMALESGPERARKLQDLVDQEIRKADHIPITCTKGCSACCHMEVEITNYEAEILFDLIDTGHVIDRPRLQTQSQRPPQDNAWRQRSRITENRCVFLGEDEACSIYESRPVMCRRHSVTTPAINCFNTEDQIGVRYFPMVDLLVVAANEDPELRIGPLAKMLEMRLQKGEAKASSSKNPAKK